VSEFPELPVQLSVPQDAREGLSKLQQIDVYIARVSGILKALKTLKELAIDRRAMVFGRVSNETRSWLLTIPQKTVVTPEGTFKRRTMQKGRIKAPRRKEEQAQLVAFLSQRFPHLLRKEIVYEYEWKEVEPVVVEHLLKEGELPFEAAIYEAPGDHLTITTLEPSEADRIATDMLSSIRQDEELEVESAQSPQG
jgi:hypothetical protein